MQENPLPCLWVLSCTCQMEHTTLPLRAVWASLRYGWAPRVCVLREGWRDVNHLCSHNFLPNFKGRGNSPPSLDKVSEPQVGSEMRLGQVLERVNISQAAMREQRLYWRDPGFFRVGSGGGGKKWRAFQTVGTGSGGGWLEGEQIERAAAAECACIMEKRQQRENHLWAPSKRFTSLYLASGLSVAAQTTSNSLA